MQRFLMMRLIILLIQMNIKIMKKKQLRTTLNLIEYDLTEFEDENETIKTDNRVFLWKNKAYF